jgi:hypothetical protein
MKKLNRCCIGILTFKKLPKDVLIHFYNEVYKNIEKGILTKTMYYELGIITSIANRRGIMLLLSADFEEEINEEVLQNFSHSHSRLD